MFLFNERVLKDLDWTDAVDWVRIEHFCQQIHEHWVFVQPVTFIFLKRLRQVLQACSLFLQDFLSLSALDTQYSHSKHLFAGLRMRSTLERQPERNASQKLQQDSPHGPHVVGPWLLLPAKISRVLATGIRVLTTSF